MSKNDIIKLLQSAGKIKTSDYTKEMEDAIVYASKSGDSLLFEHACAAVHNSLKAYEVTFLKNFGVPYGSQDYDDYMQELFIVIFRDLPEWDPKKGALTTHFRPRFLNACLETRNKNSTFSSTNYEIVHKDIMRARESLEQRQVFSPTAIEIRDYLNSIGKHYSEQTIVNCLKQECDISSIDANQDIAGEIGENPVESIIKEEYRDEILQCINSLEPQHSIIMKIEYNLYNLKEISGRLTNKMIAEEYRRIVGPSSDEWIKNIRDAAERDFEKRYKAHFFHERPQVNFSGKLQDSMLQAADEIRAAIMEDLSLIESPDDDDDMSA